MPFEIKMDQILQSSFISFSQIWKVRSTVCDAAIRISCFGLKGSMELTDSRTYAAIPA